MSENDDPVNVDENGGAAWLQDEGYRRRSSWQGAEDFEE